MFELLQPTHLLFVLLVALLVFGPKRLPELGRSVGQAISALKSGLSEDPTPRDAKAPPETAAEPSPGPRSGEAPPEGPREP